MNTQAAADLAHAETLSMPVVLVLLLVVFGGVLAAGLPLVLALVGVADDTASVSPRSACCSTSRSTRSTS